MPTEGGEILTSRSKRPTLSRVAKVRVRPTLTFVPSSDREDDAEGSEKAFADVEVRLAGAEDETPGELRGPAAFGTGSKAQGAVPVANNRYRINQGYRSPSYCSQGLDPLRRLRGLVRTRR